MLSTIVLYEDQGRRHGKADLGEALVRTLASLVAPNIHGLLCDVTIVGPPGKDLGTIADHAGCDLIEIEREDERVFQALLKADGKDAFVLRSGFALETSFSEEVADLGALYAKGSMPALRLRSQATGFFERIFPELAEPAGLIFSPRIGVASLRGGFSSLLRLARPKATLRTRARRVS
jgi:hypothetical protein